MAFEQPAQNYVWQNQILFSSLELYPDGLVIYLSGFQLYLSLSNYIQEEASLKTENSMRQEHNLQGLRVIG